MSRYSSLFGPRHLALQAEIDRLFDQMIAEGVARVYRQSHAWTPPLDVFETEQAYVVRMEIAGMRTEDFDILFQEGVLLIRGTRPEPQSPPRTYHQSQIRYGEFIAAVRFPDDVLVDEVEAVYDNGFLHVTLPKKAKNASR